jgi:protein-tyrosine phosphatase
MGVSAEVTSRGFLPGGNPSPPQVVAAVAPFHLDLSGHVSEQLSVEHLSKADVVLTMTRQHLREVVLLRSEAWPRAFTLPELVRRGEKQGLRPAGTPLSEWLDAIATQQGRQQQDLIGKASRDDIPDPYGGPNAGYRRMADTLADLTERLAQLLWAGSAEPPPDHPST